MGVDRDDDDYQGKGGDFGIEPLADRYLPEVLTALRGTFGGGFTDQWFAWKHIDNPGGPSPSWVAVDGTGVIGVRFLLPWKFADETVTVPAFRPCDTVTLPRARRRGVFQALTEHAIKAVNDSVDLLFNTPNEQSRPGYLNMGFEIWTRLGQQVGLAPWSRANLLTGPSVLPEFIERTGLTTRADSSFLTWRYVSIPHRTYHLAALRESNEPNGAIYRVRPWRGLRLLVVSEMWGPPSSWRVLLGAIARKERSLLIRIGDHQREALVLGRRGSPTVVTHKCLGKRSFPAPVLSIGDIEDVL